MQSFIEKEFGLGEEDQWVFGMIGLVGLLIGFLMGKVRRRWCALYSVSDRPSNQEAGQTCCLANTVNFDLAHLFMRHHRRDLHNGAAEIGESHLECTNAFYRL